MGGRLYRSLKVYETSDLGSAGLLQYLHLPSNGILRSFGPRDSDLRTSIRLLPHDTEDENKEGRRAKRVWPGRPKKYVQVPMYDVSTCLLSMVQYSSFLLGLLERPLYLSFFVPMWRSRSYVCVRSPFRNIAARLRGSSVETSLALP